jgi:NADH-quinone oxidoreductase subunit L
VIHAAHHEQELPQYGGLIRKIPVTGITFGIAVLAIAGMGISISSLHLDIGLSGFYSKDMILAHAAATGYFAQEGGKSGWWWAFFILPTIIAYVTAFYMTRCWMLTFWGKPRNQHLYDHAHEEPIMWVPLVALAVLSIIGGWMGIKEFLQASIVESNAYCQVQVQQADPTAQFMGFTKQWPVLEEHVDEAAAASLPEGHRHVNSGVGLMHTWVGFAWIIGIGAGFLIYRNGYSIANKLMAIPPLRWIHWWLYRRMLFDELYFAVFVDFTRYFSMFCAAFDKYIVDGLVNLAGWATKQVSFLAGANDKYVVDGAVDGVATLSQQLGAAVRAPQTGRIRMYVTVLMAAVTLGLAGAILVVLSY